MKPLEKSVLFKNLDEELLFKLQYTNGLLAFKQMALLKKFNLSPEQYHVLKAIRESPKQTLSPGEMQKYTAHRISDISRMVLRLEKKNLIERKVSKLDRRCTDIKLTTEALALLLRIDPVMQAWLTDFPAITLAEKQLLQLLLNKIVAAA